MKTKQERYVFADKGKLYHSTSLDAFVRFLKRLGRVWHTCSTILKGGKK